MRTHGHPLALLVAVALIGACTAPARDADAASPTQGRSEVEEAMKIRVIADTHMLTAELEDNAAARDFAALLPLKLTLSDYNRTEKIADLPRRLSSDGAPDGITPVAGDLAYYAPWGNLAVFYSDFGYSRGLVRLGRIEGRIEDLAKFDGPIRIELVQD